MDNTSSITTRDKQGLTLSTTTTDMHLMSYVNLKFMVGIFESYQMTCMGRDDDFPVLLSFK